MHTSPFLQLDFDLHAKADAARASSAGFSSAEAGAARLVMARREKRMVVTAKERMVIEMGLVGVGMDWVLERGVFWCQAGG